MTRRVPWLDGVSIAHRGLHGPGLPENSLGAVAAATEAGYPSEIDVRLTRDGRVVVFHDAELSRMTGRAGRVEDHTLEDLQALVLDSTSERIPSLEDLLAGLGGAAPLLIEIKTCGNAVPLAAAVARVLRDDPGHAAIQSFDVRCVLWFRRHAPAIPRGQLACRFDTDPMPGWKKFLLSRYVFNVLTRPDFLGHRWQDLPLPGMLRRSRPVLAWTTRSPEEHRMALLHADSVIFENYRPALRVAQ